MTRGRKPTIPGWLKNFVEVYRILEVPVSILADVYSINYTNVWRYMRKAIGCGYIKRKEYVNIQIERNSLAKKGKNNPNYGGKCLTDKVKSKIGEANSKLKKSDINAVALDYIYFKDPTEEIASNSNLSAASKVSECMNKAVKLKLIDLDQYVIALKRRRAEAISRERNPRYNGKNSYNNL